uniref:Uncharacterized protein n=1 Tax=Anguilla anguilla TaxID=7936 RepID=A0A0E9P8D2_ANGAN
MGWWLYPCIFSSLIKMTFSSSVSGPVAAPPAYQSSPAWLWLLHLSLTLRSG